jgi:hypothetical protein
VFQSSFVFKPVYLQSIAAYLLRGIAIAALVIATVASDAIAQTHSVRMTRAELVENLEAMIGDIVTVRSHAIKILPDGNFWIEGEPLVTGDNIFVINATGGAIPERRHQYINFQITGEIRHLELAQLEREIDAVSDSNFDQNLYVEYRGIPTIVAQSIAIAPSPGEVTANPEWYYNRPVAIEAEIATVFSQKVFTLAEEQLFGGQNLLAIKADSHLANLSPDRKVVVTGVIRPFTTVETDRNYNLIDNLNLLRQLEVEYRNQPFLSVDEIH